MECINIRVNNGRVDVTVDGAKLTDVHSVSVDYIRGHSAPVFLRRGRRPGTGRSAGTENPALNLLCVPRVRFLQHISGLVYKLHTHVVGRSSVECVVHTAVHIKCQCKE